jgi:translation elongation factor EF-G
MILQPIMNVEVTTPQEYQNNVVGDLNRRKGVIQDSTSQVTLNPTPKRKPEALGVRGIQYKGEKDKP